MAIAIKPFGNIGKYPVYQALITNTNGHAISVLNFGGILRRWLVPDSKEKTTNIVLGYNTLEHYVEDPYYMGAIMGRVSNRIANRRFTLNGETYLLSKNTGINKSRHHLHGGKLGLSKRLWEMQPDSRNNKLRLTYHSPEGEEGYPGDVDFRVDYQLKGNSLMLDFYAKPNKPTPISLTQHYYFNLNGDGRAVRHIEEGVVRAMGGGCTKHVYQILADRYLETTPQKIPTGKVLPVENTPFNFRAPRTLVREHAVKGENITRHSKKEGRGGSKKTIVEEKAFNYDKYLLFHAHRHIKKPVAKAWGEKSNIAIALYTDNLGMQFYNSYRLDRKYAAFCFEPQHHPNAVNLPRFPSPIVTPNAPYKHHCQFTTSLENAPAINAQTINRAQ